MAEELEKGNVIKIIALILVVMIATYFIQPLIHENENALNTIVTIFSILSGFAILVITQLGDISMIPDGNWRVAKEAKRSFKKRLRSQKFLYLLYISTLILALLTTLSTNTFYIVHYLIEYTFLCLALISLLASLKLPYIIENIQDYRYDLVIDDRKKEEREKAKEIRDDKN